MMDMLIYVAPALTCFITVLGYTRVQKKDNEKYTKDMTTLITKVDMLLSQTACTTLDVKQHAEMLIRHDVKIQELEKTVYKK